MTDILDQISASNSALFAPSKQAKDLVIIFSDRPAGYRTKRSWTGLQNIANPTFDHLILRDPGGQWYQRGQPGLTTSFRETVALLSQVIDAGDYATVHALGYSAGTHAALVLSALLKLDAVICFGCRTSLRPKERLEDTREDSPVRQSLEALWTAQNADPALFDVREVLKRKDAAQTPIRIYYDPKQPKDAKSYRRIARIPRITARAYPGVGHDVHELADRAFVDDPWLAGRGTYRKHGLISALGGTKLADALARSRKAGAATGTSR